MVHTRGLMWSTLGHEGKMYNLQGLAKQDSYLSVFTRHNQSLTILYCPQHEAKNKTSNFDLQISPTLDPCIIFQGQATLRSVTQIHKDKDLVMKISCCWSLLFYCIVPSGLHAHNYLVGFNPQFLEMHVLGL